MSPLLLAIIAGGGVAAVSSAGAFVPISHTLSSNNQRDAFLAVIRAGESNGDYKAIYGGGQFSSYSDHPANTGEWKGTFVNGVHTSAAGAYQFEVGTWNELKATHDYPSFAPEWQDQAAIDRIAWRGALDAIDAGDLDTAVSKLMPEWQFFTGNTGWTSERVASTFVANGGTLA